MQINFVEATVERESQKGKKGAARLTQCIEAVKASLALKSAIDDKRAWLHSGQTSLGESPGHEVGNLWSGMRDDLGALVGRDIDQHRA